MDKDKLSAMGAWPGGTVVDLAVCGDTVLAATFAGIYTSIDGGGTWALTGKNLPDWFVQTVALAPSGEQAIGLAASHLGWLYRSLDSGATWELDAYWSNMGIITRLVASPNFGTDGIIFACTEQDGVYKSADRGYNWKAANFGLLNLSVSTLCFSPDFEQDEVLFAGTDGGGLFRSRNAGRAWRESGTGLPDSAVQCLGISPRFGEDGTVFAGTEEAGIYVSTDGGRNWTPASESLAESCINALYIADDWDNGGSIIAAADGGLLTSTDKGQTWQPTAGGPEYPYVLAKCGATILTGAYEDGVYASQDGIHWTVCNEGLSAHLPPLAVFSTDFQQDGTVVMASMEGELVGSTDGGKTWAALAEEFSVSSMASTGAGTSMALLAAAEGALLYSPDAGQTWQSARSTGADTLTAVAFGDNGETLAATASGQVFVGSTENPGGQHIGQVGEMVVAIAAISLGDDLLPVVVTAAQQDDEWLLNLRRGVDGALLFAQQANEPIAALYPLPGERLLCSLGSVVAIVDRGMVLNVNTLEADAPVACLGAAGDTLLAGSRFGLFCSNNGGASWEWLTSDISAVTLHTEHSGRVTVVEMGGRIWQVDI
jgi:photosystem II stability/assembly factor-like uncharacterized protein